MTDRNLATPARHLLGKIRVGLSLGLLGGLAAGVAYAEAVPPAQRPAGRIGAGAAVLPDNRMASPAGRIVPVGNMPLGMALSPDGRHMLVSADGGPQNYLQNIDLVRGALVQSLAVDGELFYGVAFSPAGDRAYAAGGGSGKIFSYEVDGQGLLRSGAAIDAGGFPGGLAVLPAGGVLLTADNLGARLTVAGAPGLQASLSVGSHPLAVAVAADGRRAYVADAGSDDISVVDLASEGKPSLARTVQVGAYPTAEMLSHDGRTLYVANANGDSVSAIDTASLAVTRTLSLRPAGAPPGSAPDALAISPDDGTLYVANAGNNDVAVVAASSGTVQGLIPTGWWPSAVALSPDGRTLYVLSAKGLGFIPNTRFQPYGPRDPNQYIGSGIHGSLSIVPVPDSAALRRYTARALALAAAPAAGQIDGNPIPATPGGPTPFRHVIVVDKENRSYDQVFGDEPQGNGDPSLVLFGRNVTPNLHALAERFGLLDNTYADGEVSADGHQWLDGAYATVYLQQTWPERYGRLAARPADFGIAPISFPPSGYIFGAAAAQGVSYRVYGEQFNAGPLQLAYLGHADLGFLGFNLLYRDVQREAEWQREFAAFVRGGNLPQLEYVWLPRDHTSGGLGGQSTPQAQVADNDLATGRLVDAVSHSRYWRDTLILVIEDDAQDGPDHVDGHRTEALAISAYNKVGAVIHTHYDQLSVLRTLELVLGLAPLSQFDARALPMYDVFRDGGQPDLRPYAALPARVALQGRNAAGTALSRRSAALDFSGPDRAPAGILNRLIWTAVRGPQVPYPAPAMPDTRYRPGGD